MSGQWPPVAFLIPNWNGGSLVLECLQSIKDLDYPEKEILVIDNASKDDSADQIESRFPQVRLLRNRENVGFGAALNQGLRETQSPLVAFVNNDAVLSDAWLLATVKALGGDPEAAMATGPIWFAEMEDILWGYGGRVDLLTGIAWDVGKGGGHLPPPGDVDYLQAAALLARRKALEEVGLWDEAYFAYFEDTDLACRLRASGYRLLLLPEAGSRHQGLATPIRGQPERKFYLFVRSNLRFILKNLGRAHRVAALSLALVFYVLFAVVAARRGGLLAQVGRALAWNLRNLRETLRAGPLPPGVLKVRFTQLLKEMRRRRGMSNLLPY